MVHLLRLHDLHVCRHLVAQSRCVIRFTELVVLTKCALDFISADISSGVGCISGWCAAESIIQ